MKKITDRRFLGSTLTLTVGIPFLFAIFAPLAEYPDSTDTFFTGFLVMIGSVVYRSAKKRKLGMVKKTKTRQFFEVIGLILIFIIAVSRNNLFLGYILLVWIISSYLIVLMRGE